MSRAGWGLAAALAGVALVGLALHGQRPGSGFARFEAAGVMDGIRPEDVREVRIVAGDRDRRFRRGAGGRWTGDDDARADRSSAVDRGLRFLHVSAPQRVLERDELPAAVPSEFGLTPPRYVVTVQGAGPARFTIEFGALNAQGLAQYARVPGRETVLLLPRFVGEPWQAVAGPP